MIFQLHIKYKLELKLVIYNIGFIPCEYFVEMPEHLILNNFILQINMELLLPMRKEFRKKLNNIKALEYFTKWNKRTTLWLLYFLNSNISWAITHELLNFYSLFLKKIIPDLINVT